MNDGAGSEGTGREDAGEMLAVARTADEDLVVPEIIEGNRLNRDTLAGRVQHRAPIAHCERLRPRFYRTVVWYIVPARGTAGGEAERAYPRAAAAASVRGP